MFAITLTPTLAQDDSTGENAANRMKNAIGTSDLASLPEEGIEPIIGGLINTFLSLMGIVFLILTIYGGWKWMMAQGREEEVKKAKDVIKSSIIGLGVIFLAYAITYFIVFYFENAA